MISEPKRMGEIRGFEDLRDKPLTDKIHNLCVEYMETQENSLVGVHKLLVALSINVTFIASIIAQYAPPEMAGFKDRYLEFLKDMLMQTSEQDKITNFLANFKSEVTH